MTDKKLFSSLSGLVIGVVAGAGIIAAPTAAFADHHNEHDHDQEHGETRSSTWVLETGCQGWAAAPDFGAEPAKNPAPVRARG